MTESKAKRLIVSITAGAVLLLVILLSVLVYQIVSIKKERDSLKEYNEQIAYYEQLIREKGDTLEARRQRWWIERRARELGYKFPDDVGLTD